MFWDLKSGPGATGGAPPTPHSGTRYTRGGPKQVPKRDLGWFWGRFWGQKTGKKGQKKCLLIILPFGTKLATFCHFFATFWPLFGHFLATFGHFLPLLATFLPQFRAFLATFRALLATFRVLQPSNHSMDPFMVSNHTYDDHPLMVTIRCVE